MRRNLRADASQVLTRLVLGLLLLVFVAWLLERLFAWGTCHWYGSETGRQVRYSAFIGCMVKTGDAWVPRTELRVIQ